MSGEEKTQNFSEIIKLLSRGYAALFNEGSDTCRLFPVSLKIEREPNQPDSLPYTQTYSSPRLSTMDYEVRSANWITGRMDETTVSLEDENMLASYNVVETTSRIRTSLVNGQPHFLVEVKTDGILNEIENKQSKVINQEYLNKIEKAMYQKINTEIRWAIQKAQTEFRTDHLGFRLCFGKYIS